MFAASAAVFLVALIVRPMFEGVPRAFASPYALTAANDPRDPANCINGAGPLDGNGWATWCRGAGIVSSSPAGSRFKGYYIVIVNNPTTGEPQIWYVWCEQDGGTHPKVLYTAAEIVDGEAMAQTTTGHPLVHPEGAQIIPIAMGIANDAQAGSVVIPGFTTARTPAELACALWGIGHFVVGDTSTSGTVVVPTLAANTGCAAATAELWDYGTRLSNLTVGLGHSAISPGSNAIDFTMTQATDGGAVDASILYATIDSASNLAWRGTGVPVTATADSAISNGSPGTVIAAGQIVFQLQVIDPTQPATLNVSRTWTSASSWKGLPASGGQQSTGAYFAPANSAMPANSTAAPIAVAQKVRKAFDNSSYTGPLAGWTFHIVHTADDAVAADVTTDSTGVTTQPFVAIIGDRYCATETTNPDAVHVDLSSPVCFTADGSVPTVTVTNHLRAASVNGRKTDDRGVAAGGATLHLDCDGGRTITDAQSATDGSWSFGPVSMATGPAPKNCVVTETGAPAGQTIATGTVASFTLSPGQTLDLTSAPVVNTWNRSFGSATSTPIALGGDTVTEYAYGKNLSPGEVVTVRGSAYRVADGAATPSTATSAGLTPIASFGPWTLTGNGTREVLAGQSWTIPAAVCGGLQIELTFTNASGAMLGTEGWSSTAQHIDVQCVQTTIPSVIADDGASLIDHGTVRGIPATGLVSAVVSLPLVRHLGDCADGVLVGTGSVPVTASGPFTSGAVATGHAGFAYTFQESLTTTSTRANAPAGWATPIPGTTGESTIYTTTTKPEHCNPDETVFIGHGSTTAQRPTLVPGSGQTDSFTYWGLPSGTPDRPVSVADGGVTWGDWTWKVTVTGGLYRWAQGATPDCSGTKLAVIDATAITANGTTTGLGYWPVPITDTGGSAVGYVETVTTTVTNNVTGTTKTSVHSGACGETAETANVVAALASPVVPAGQVPTDEVTASTVTQQPFVLPTTGAAGIELVLEIGGLIATIGVCLMIAGSSRRRRRSSGDRSRLRV